jgi:hypothetical protein
LDIGASIGGLHYETLVALPSIKFKCDDELIDHELNALAIEINELNKLGELTGESTGKPSTNMPLYNAANKNIYDGLLDEYLLQSSTDNREARGIFRKYLRKVKSRSAKQFISEWLAGNSESMVLPPVKESQAVQILTNSDIDDLNGSINDLLKFLINSYNESVPEENKTTVEEEITGHSALHNLAIVSHLAPYIDQVLLGVRDIGRKFLIRVFINNLETLETVHKIKFRGTYPETTLEHLISILVKISDDGEFMI